MFGVDNKQVKRILERVDWITLCAKLLIVELAAKFKIELPPPPED
jgi:hypothetical protein